MKNNKGLIRVGDGLKEESCILQEKSSLQFQSRLVTIQLWRVLSLTFHFLIQNNFVIKE